jgi:diguanylate cyclase (GGDEF)-like protein
MAQPHDDLEELLESTWSGRGRRFASHERRVESGLTAVFLLGAGALLTTMPASWRPDALLIAFVVAYAAASLVSYPLGVSDIVPTQPFLVVLFAFAPAAAVPLLVFAGLALGRLVHVARGHRHPERLLLSGGDAVHSLGPALVFAAAGFPYAKDAPWELWAAAFLAQLLFDSGSATLRDWFVFRVKPQLQLRLLGQVAALDSALVPLGLLAVMVGDVPYAPFGLLPLVGLLAFTARDRAERTSRLSSRFHALQNERHRLQVAVKRIGEAFASNLDLDALLDITTRAAVDALNADAGRASAVEGVDRKLIRRSTVSEDETLAGLLDQAEALVLGRDDLAATTDDDASAIAFALRAGKVPTATIAVARRGDPFTDEERELFEYLCEQAAVAAENVSRHETLHEQALTDELTGLANHRRLQDLLATATERYRRTGAQAALLLLDLDHFKLVNDVHGHQVGDKVLRAVGRHLRASCRAADEPARYGGEELAVVLEDSTLERATDLAERLRGGIGELELTGSQGERLRVTVSVGVALIDEHTATSAALIAAADAALYTAKLHGRDRVEVASTGGERPAQVRPFADGGPLAQPRAGQHALAELALTLARALDAKQPSTAGHSETVAHFSALIAEGLGLQPSHVYRVWLAGMVHDVGKVAIPDQILNKPGPLSASEFEQMKTHSQAGYELLAGTGLAEQAVWVRHHHERLDGSGYPDRLAGDDIEIEARIIHVADAFEAMISDRPYRRGISRADAALELLAHSGTQFDPACVEILLGSLELAGQTIAAPRGGVALTR